MKIILDYILSAIYYLYFGLMLLIFHVAQMIAFHVFGKRAQLVTSHYLNAFLLYGMWLIGVHPRFMPKFQVPTDRPIIFIANHQSMFDILGLTWFFHKNTPIFISKIELAKGYPSISYNLQKSGAALIDRKDGKQAVTEIARLAKHIETTKYSAVIFPEGTRSKTGQLKDFAIGGVATLLKRSPSALVVPVAIQGNSDINSKPFPLSTFKALSWTSLEPIDPKGKTAEEVVALARTAIASEMEQA